ncbi:MAG: PadR family transcriptional regulator [Solirubrobacteraceae bacterium]|jgi:PadR family transcriptional regulator, regulatory protein AphA
MADREDLTPTGRVILGMLAMGNSSGYDIKQFVDKSTRHFWAASYGQIYPELKRLEDAGLVQGRQEPTGERARTVYDVTDAGREALHSWLASSEPLAYELRDEGMLKLFFSDNLPERRVEIIREMRERSERKLAQLRAIRPHAEGGPTGPRLTLDLGMTATECLIKWCEATERRLADDREME